MTITVSNFGHLLLPTAVGAPSMNFQKVQRKFTNLIDDIDTLPYGTRLAELDLTTLAERRVRGDLIETFKIVNNVVDYGHDIFVLGRSGRNIVSCGLKVSCFRKKFFSERVIQYWNVLPNFVKLSSSVNAFKANLCVHKSQQLKSEHYVSSVGNFWEVSERLAAYRVPISSGWQRCFL